MGLRGFLCFQKGQKRGRLNNFDFLDEVGIFFGELLSDVEVYVSGHSAVGVSEAAADDIERDPVLSQKSHVRVAK